MNQVSLTADRMPQSHRIQGISWIPLLRARGPRSAFDPHFLSAILTSTPTPTYRYHPRRLTADALIITRSSVFTMPRLNHNKLITLTLVGVQSIAISKAVCVCTLAYLINHTFKLHKIFCTCHPWPWLDPLTTTQYAMYLRFCGWCHVLVQWRHADGAG